MKADTKNDKAILLNLPNQLCEEVDNITDELGMTRTTFLQQSIKRYVEYMNEYQLPDFRVRQRNYNKIKAVRWMPS